MRAVAERRRARSLQAAAALAGAGGPAAWCRATMRSSDAVAALDERLAAVCQQVPALPTLTPANLLGTTLEAYVLGLAVPKAVAQPVEVSPATPDRVTEPTQSSGQRRRSAAAEKPTMAPAGLVEGWTSGPRSGRLGRRPASDAQADQAAMRRPTPLPNRDVRMSYGRLRTLAASADAPRTEATRPGVARRSTPRVPVRANPPDPADRSTPLLPMSDVAEHVERVATRVRRRIGGDALPPSGVPGVPLPGFVGASPAELRRTLQRWSSPPGAAAPAGMPGIIHPDPASARRTRPGTAASGATARRSARPRRDDRMERSAAGPLSIPVAHPVKTSRATGLGPGAVGELHRLAAPAADGLVPTVAGYIEQPGQPARLADLTGDHLPAVEHRDGGPHGTVVHPAVEPSARDTSAVAGVGSTVPTVSAPELERVLGRVLTDAARRHGIEV